MVLVFAFRKVVVRVRLRYWQVTSSLRREPEQTSFLHGRFGWEKKNYRMSSFEGEGVFAFGVKAGDRE